MTVRAVPRLIQTSLAAALEVMPAVVITGARQTGRSTLVNELTPADDRLYLTLDDLDVFDQATRAPQDLVARAPRITLGEIQLAPDLLRAIKRAIDRRRTHGRFILTTRPTSS